MSHWILFVFVVVSNGASDTTTMATQIFHSQKSCEAAAVALKQSALSFETITTVCVEDKPAHEM